jgi:CRP-like cAMP-binding protein
VTPFDRTIAVATLVLALVAAWAAWFPYRWQRAERLKREDTEKRLDALMGRLNAKPLEAWEAIDAADEDAVSLGIQGRILVRRLDSDGRWLVRRRLGPGD